MKYDSHIVLDLEFNPTVRGRRAPLRDEIIEIGAIKLDSEYREIDRFSCFVKPRYNRNITPEIVKLTGINNSDVADAPDFAEAMERFAKWAGEGRCRVYSWSDSDYIQMRCECCAKGVEMPAFMARRLDLQRVWQRMNGLPDAKQMSLKNAATYSGVVFSEESAHRAMYDTEITVELLNYLVSGEYLRMRERIKEMMQDNNSRMTSSLGSLCPGLGALLSKLSA